MLFHTFQSQEERRAHGGSAFLEMQFCDRPPHAPIRMLVAPEHIQHWKNDSLYIDDEARFERVYGRLFVGGVHSNLQTGAVDLYGVNYYAPALVDPLIERIAREKPLEHEVLVAWLISARARHGFYLLGL